MTKGCIIINILCLLFLLGGCAFDVMHIEHFPAELDSRKSCNISFVLVKNVDIQVDEGYNRTLKQGTRWNCIGRIEQGEVYKTKDQILTIEASNVFEAYIVVASRKLVGFYLPVEHAFSGLKNPIDLVIDESPQIESKNN